MWLLILEAGVALGLFILSLWWIIAPVKRREERQEIELNDEPTRTDSVREGPKP